jgi:hypothetical protein
MSKAPSVTLGTEGENAKDNTLILYHNKFHWAWFIPVDSETVSIGLVTSSRRFSEGKANAGRILPQRHLHH